MLIVVGAASGAARVDGRLSIDPPARATAGQQFQIDTLVESLPIGSGASFDFTLTLTVPQGVEVLAWSSVVVAPACTSSTAIVTCRSKVLGGEIHSTDIGFAVRASRPGRYVFRAALALEGAPDAKPADNTTEVEVIVGAAAAPARRNGTARNDVLRGTPGDDRIFGLAGSDTLRGLGGNDLLDGGPGNDRLFGDAGNDRLVGGAGNDALVGGAGVNVYIAGTGNDTIDAVNGRRESITCGAGRDSVRADGSDRLTGCELVRRR
jgi:Ca2+-binding RTX toxin-like protein